MTIAPPAPRHPVLSVLVLSAASARQFDDLSVLDVAASTLRIAALPCHLTAGDHVHLVVPGQFDTRLVLCRVARTTDVDVDLAVVDLAAVREGLAAALELPAV